MALTELDRNLIDRCLRRDPGSWNDFVDRFIGLFIHVVDLTAHARSVTLQAADRDDLISEIFSQVLDDDLAVLRRFAGRSSLATYLTVVARRIVVHEIVRRRRDEGLGLEEPTTASEESRVADQELIETLLNRLPARESTIVRMFHLQGRSYAEIASLLQIPEATVGTILARARRQMERAHLRVVGNSADKAAS